MLAEAWRERVGDRKEEDEERLRAKVDKYKTTIRSLTDKVYTVERFP
jgi:hypothetical protein